MRTLVFAPLLVIALLASTFGTSVAAPSVPALFTVETVGTGFDTPTAIAFLPGGRMLVAEKRGQVHTLLNGVKSVTPLWSRENEVLNHHDRGLLGLAVDPNYVANRYIYLLYTVDPDSNGNDNTNDDAFGRLVRYQVSATDSNTVDYSTRAVLVGRNWRNGPLSASPSHTIGALRFGSDGSLLASMGDGASFNEMDDGGLDANAFGSGGNKTDPYEDIGAFRAQSLTSLCGKILRLNPATGHGYPSNPYWDGNATSIRSRVWAYGVRNPFRFGIRPGTGSADPSDGDPGTLFIGDVGWGTWEDQNVVRVPGTNFGWPCYEGFNTQGSYQGGAPAHNGCGSYGQPDNPAGPTAPDAAWHHSNTALSVPPGSKGNAAVGGAFYTGNRYPTTYRSAYFFADYGQSWLKVATYDVADQLVSIQNFGTAMDSPVDLVADPITGDIHYVAIGQGQVRRIRYTGTVPNQPPVAAASGSPTAGVMPLAVSFSGTGSSDPDNDPLGYAWDYGDGSSGTGLAASHTYVAPGVHSAVLTVTDGRGGMARDTVVVIVMATGEFPTTPVVDDFDRPNGPIGGAWTGDTGSLAISNQELIQPSGGASAVWNGAVFGPNQEAFVTLDAVTASSPEHDLMLKIQGTNWSSGHLEVRYDAPLGRVSVGSYHPGSGWQTYGHVQPISFGPGDQLGARAFEDGTVQVFKNGVLAGTHSAAAWPFARLGGRIGMTLSGAVSSRLDDFGGGNVGLQINTAPTAIVLSPVDVEFYAAGDTIWLHGDGSDAQDTPAQLQYEWRVDLHHNTHVHPSVFVSELRDDYMVGENHDDGTGIHQVVHLLVTDRGGKKDTASVSIHPEVNLRPTATTTFPDPPLAGLPADYEFELENTGRMPSPIVHWILHTEDGLLAEGDTLVPPMDRVVVRRTLPSPPAGRHTFRVVVDSLPAVVEVVENDNAAARDIDVLGSPLAVGDVPATLDLSLPHPNPSAGASRLRLALPAAATVTFEVFDLQGRSAWRAPVRALEAGRWDLAWPGRSGTGMARPGVYLAMVTVGDQTFVRRIVRVK